MKDQLNMFEEESKEINDMNDFGFDADFDFSVDFNLDLDFDFEANFETRYMKPVKTKSLKESAIKYEKAVDLAQNIEISKDMRQFCIVSGAFIFGDFIEAFIVENDIHIKKMTISTLSMSQGNIDSFKNLIVGDYVDELEIICSTYFYAHERKGLIPYLYKELDRKDKFQLAVADVHTKICMFETYSGSFVVIHGSANLRSSNCVEQFVIEENGKLYEFCQEFHSKVIDKYKTIDKSVRNKAMINIINDK